MRRVDFDDLEACGQSPRGRGVEAGDDLPDAGFIEGARGWVAVIEWHNARGHDCPPAFLGRQTTPTFPWRFATTLTAGMRELDPCSGALRVNEPCDARKRLDVLVAPDSHVCGRDTALTCYSARFDE